MPLAAILIGGGLAVGGTALGARGKKRPHFLSEQDLEARLPGRVQEALSRAGEISREPFPTLTPEQQEATLSRISTTQQLALPDIIDRIRAEAGRAGRTTVPAFAGSRIARVLGDVFLGQRLQAEQSLEEQARKLQILGRETRFGEATTLAQIRPGLQPGGQFVERTPTFGQQVGPALAGFGGQLAGFGVQDFLGRRRDVAFARALRGEETA